MELILTSFGASHLRPRRDDNANMFYPMPPVSMWNVTSIQDQLYLNGQPKL
jgi:hypothetical protein